MFKVNLMFNRQGNANRKMACVLGLLAGLMTSNFAMASQSRLELAESYRMQSQSARIDCQVELYDQEQLTKTREFQVFAGTENRSLVVFKSAADAGQKVLMSGKDFWMFMPKSRRPIRITPMQRLLGEAALGDVASLNWSQQYQVTDEQAHNEKLMLTLSARDESASYQKIELHLDPEDSFPVSADLYLRSGVLAKTARFERGERDGRLAVVAMSLQDRLHPASKTIIRYQSVLPIEVPDKYFNPQILVRSNLEELLMD